MTYLTNLKKIGVKSTILASSLSLVACGGGGGGYYGDNGSSTDDSGTNGQNPSDTSQVPDSLGVTLQNPEGSALQIAQDNSKVQIAVKLLNKDKGGIAGKDIRLVIADTQKIGVDSEKSKVTTGDDGVAIFTLNIPALQAETGTVQLTATVDGTTITMPYTLNIKKTSTIASDYNLSVQQGVVLNLPKGSVNVPVQVTDINGGAKAGQTVEMTLPETMQGKFVITSGSSISTDAEGKATFTIQANADLTTEQVAALVDSSQKLSFKLIDEHRAEKQAVAALTFKDISRIVETLEVITPETSITAKAGKAVVRIFAKNSNGDILANTKVKLAVEAVAASYGVTLDKAEAVTNAKGYAEFTLSSEATHPIALAQRGIELTATYTENNQNIKGNATVQVITADETVDDQEAIQRLEISSPFKINAQNDQVTIKVKAVNFKGIGATSGKIAIGLNPEAMSNGVTFAGASAKAVDKNGFVEFVLKTNAKDAAIERLVNAGITATFTSENGASNKIEIKVENEAVSEEAISYLQIDPILETFDPNKDQTIMVKVKAIGVKGSPLKNQKIALKPNAQFNSLGLTLSSQAEQLTDTNGYVTYNLTYKYNKTQAQQDAAKAGIVLAVASVSDTTKTQSTKVNFKTVNDKVELDYVTIDTVGSKDIQLNSNTTIIVDAKVMGVDGSTLAGQKVTLDVDSILLSNGVSYNGQTTTVSNANGQVQFKLNVNARNQTQLSALIASGLPLTISSKRTDGTSFTVTRKIELVASTGGANVSQVDYLLIDPILNAFDPTKDQTVTVKVKAVARDGSPLANEKINIKTTLANTDLVKLNLSLASSATQQTDESGYATFVYNYKFANTAEQKNLPVTGVTLVATSANAKEQTLKLNFQVPVVETTLDLDHFTVDTDGKVVLNLQNKAQSAIKVRAIGTDGKALANQNITISIDAMANNGVTVDKIVKTTNGNGTAEFALNINTKNNEELQTLLKNGLTITASSPRKDGSSYAVVRKIAVVAAEPASKVGYLAVDPISTVFDYSKDQTIAIKVKALKEDGSIAPSEKVNITALTSDMAQKLGLTLTSAAEQVTDTSGYATFVFSYKFANTTEQKKLPVTGVSLTVTSNGKSQPVKLNFKAPDVQQTLDYFTLTSSHYAVVLDGKVKTVTITVDARDENGAALAGQALSIGLNDAALPNGVTLTSPTTTTTGVNGKATFTLKIDPKTETAIDNLDINDLTVVVVGKRPDGSQYSAVQKIELSKPEVLLQDLANIEITPVQSTLSVLGGETRVRLVARDAAGKAIPNTPIAVALSSLTSTRVTIGDIPAVTNSKGEAEFTVTVAEGEYDPALIKNGIVFAVVGTNLNNGDRLQQTSSIGITAPANALNPRLRADSNTVAAGQTVKIYASVKDEMGINTATGTPMRLTLNQDALNAGVRFGGNVETTSVVVQNGSDVPVDLVIPKGLSAATLSSIILTGTIKDPRGVEIKTPTLTLTVEDIVNPNHLVFGTVSNTTMEVNGDQSIITVQLLDQTNQPVKNQNVTLSANNSASLIIATPGESHPANTSGEPQTVKTDSNGNAFFSIEIAGGLSDVAKKLLLASQIELTASHTSENGAKTAQVYRIATADHSGTPTVQPARYSLRIAAKPTMSVRDDTADVTVTLVDGNGGGVADRYVTLGLDDFARNGAIIVGGSGLTTDENGQAVFKVKVDESTRRNYTAAEFVNDDLHLTARFNETGYAEAIQISVIDIVQAAVQNPVASIVIGVNPTEVGSSSDGVYYTKNMSVSVTDFDGKPLANQVVTLEATPTTYIKGRNLWALAPKVGADPAEKWVFAGEQYYDLANPNIYLTATGIPMHNNGTPVDMSDDYRVGTTLNTVQVCAAAPSGAAVGTNNTPVKVVSFVSQSGKEQNTFTTDSNGKFDFAMRYPKIYAQWLNVQIGASATVASLPNRTTYNLGLAPLSSDYSNDGTYSPNERSPYGTQLTCP